GYGNYRDRQWDNGCARPRSLPFLRTPPPRDDCKDRDRAIQLFALDQQRDPARYWRSHSLAQQRYRGDGASVASRNGWVFCLCAHGNRGSPLALSRPNHPACRRYCRVRWFCWTLVFRKTAQLFGSNGASPRSPIPNRRNRRLYAYFTGVHGKSWVFRRGIFRHCLQRHRFLSTSRATWLSYRMDTFRLPDSP